MQSWKMQQNFGLCSCLQKMKQIKLEDKAVYWPGDVATLFQVERSKITVIEKKEGYFALTYDGQLLRIEIKAAYRFINRGLCRAKYISLKVH